MKHLAFLLALAVVAGPCGAQPLGKIGQVTLIDRDSGEWLTPHRHAGEYWVAGRPGARYAIEISNTLGERLLAVTSVDGVNVLSGETASWNQNGYVLDRNDSYQITGWRKSDAVVAAFTFTESPHSYAERTGRPANVGVIGVAFFRERRPVIDTPPVRRPPEPGLARPPAAAAPSAAGRPVPVPAQPDIVNPPAEVVISPAERAAPPPVQPPPGNRSPGGEARPGPKLGTGYGQRETSVVNHTRFDRLHEEPDEIVRIRYDSLTNLIAMGIIRVPGRPVAAPEPFPTSSAGYVPDPPPELR